MHEVSQSSTAHAACISCGRCRLSASGVAIFALLAALAMLVAGCGPEKTSSPGDSGSSVASSLDLGEDWEGSSPQARSGSSSARRPSGEPQQTSQEQGRWCIVLGTFSGDNHAEQARVMQREITANVQDLAGATVHSTDRGSMLIYGSYSAADDPRATAALERVKELTINNRPVFARAFLTPTPRTHSARSASPNDLLKVRERHPNVHPLYTLQVAVWGDFDSGRLSAEEIRRQAEAHAQRLRAEGHEAYVYHDDRQRQSLVTVGLFDRTAMDSKTGEFGPEIRTLQRRFPVHLVNGEELHEPTDRRRPERGTRVQKPFLVIVPRVN